MAPSQIQVASNALERLLKEEQSYYKEQEQQETSIAKLEKESGGEDEDGNKAFQLKQEVCLTHCPLSMFLLPGLRESID